MTTRQLRIILLFGLLLSSAPLGVSAQTDITTWYLASKSSTRSSDSWLGPVTDSCVHPRWRPPADPTFPNRATPFDVAIIGQDQIFRIQIDSGFALPGSSGSPVFAEDGRVVGIIFSGASEGRAAAELASAILVSAALEGCPR